MLSLVQYYPKASPSYRLMFQIVWDRAFLALFSMPLDRGPRGGKRYGAGRRLLSPSRFLKSSENRERNKKKWNQQHTRIYIKKAIHETWKRLKGSVVSVFDRHSHKLMGWNACTLHHFYLYLYAAPYFGLLTHFASCFFVAGLERRIFKCWLNWAVTT